MHVVLGDDRLSYLMYTFALRGDDCILQQYAIPKEVIDAIAAVP